MENKHIGKKGEEHTCGYLKRRGYEILQRNYSVKGSEIDIIAKKDDEIHFVEVKTRRQDYYGTPAEAVDYRKQRSIIHGAKYYLMRNPEYFDMICSFDVAEVYIKKGFFFNVKINYIENAYETESRYE